MRPRCGTRPAAVLAIDLHSHFKENEMKKTLCAMKAALGVRGIGGCGMWRWVLYHTI